MYTRKKKPNWFSICMVLLTILVVCLYVLIKSEPIKVSKVVVSDKAIIGDTIELDQHLCTIDDTSTGQDNLTAGAILQVNNYLYQSSLGDAQSNGVVVTASQQDFEEDVIIAEQVIYEPYEYFHLTEREEYLLAKIVQCEAGNQKMEAKEAVVMTILNRVDDIRFPNTIEEVITQNDNGVYQFSPLIEGGSWYYTEPTGDSYDAIKNIQYGYSDKYLWLDCLYFESFPPDVENWHSKNLYFKVQYGDMKFYSDYKG